MLKNASSETFALWISEDVEVEMILEINQRDPHIAIPIKFDNVCRVKKYAFRSEFCSIALLFSLLVYCCRRVLELANNVTFHKNS